MRIIMATITGIRQINQRFPAPTGSPSSARRAKKFWFVLILTGQTGFRHGAEAVSGLFESPPISCRMRIVTLTPKSVHSISVFNLF